MANISQEQTAVVCHLCEQDYTLKWKCLECGYMMCQRCRDKIHPKFPFAEVHTIVDIHEIDRSQSFSQSTLDFCHLKCEKHVGKYCCLYCKTCDILVCGTCIAKTHKGHNFNEISEEYQTKKGEIKDLLDILKTEINTVTLEREELKKIECEEHFFYKQVQTEIIENGVELQKVARDHTDTLLCELDDKWAKLSNSISVKDQEVVLRLEKLKKKYFKANHYAETNSVGQVLSDVSFLRKSDVKGKHETFEFSGIPEIIKANTADIKKRMGHLHIGRKANNKLRVIRDYFVDLCYPICAESCSDGTLWLYNNDLGCACYKCDTNGCTLIYKDLHINDMGLLKSGDLLVCIQDISQLRLISHESGDLTDSVFDVKPLQPTTVHVIGKKVMIGAVDKSIITNKGHTGHRQILVMDQNGQKLNVFQYDEKQNPLFTFPARVTGNFDNNIAVIDQLSDDCTGRVILLNYEGRIVNTYAGYKSINSEQSFKPMDIIQTPKGNFIVTDPPTKTIHVLSRGGEFITYHAMQGRLLPFSLSFKNTGHLVVAKGIPPEFIEEENFEEWYAHIQIIDNFMW